METAGTESTAVATNPSAASSSPLPTRNTPPDTPATVDDEAEHTSATVSETEHTQTAGGVSLDSTRATTDPVTSTQPTFTDENSSSEVIHDVGIDDENRRVDSDMFAFVSIDLRDKDEQRPRGFFAKDSKSADDDDVSRGDFGERPTSGAHSTDRAEGLDVSEDDVPDPFAAEDPFGNVILGTNPPPVYPLSEWKEGIFINNNNNNNNNAESFPMVLLSGQSTPKKTQPLTAERVFQNLFPEKQTLQSLDQAACEEGIHQQKSVSQSSISSGNASKGSGPGPGADNRGEAERAMVEDGGQTKSLTPLQQLLSLWYVALIFLTPVILLPLPLVISTPEAKCAYVIFVMAVFWVTEVVPIAVTSLMPIFLLPMMGLLTARNTSSAYINDTSILFMGGLTVAIAIETWNLHRRIALAVMMVVGSEPRWLMLGMMAVTWFLSMWISNTATTAMMLPIVQAVLQQISSADSVQPDTDTPRSEQHNVDIAPALNAAEDKSTTDKETGKASRLTNRIWRFRTGERDKSKAKEPKCASPKQMSMKKLEKALSLSIAYAANVGGIASLTGTGPNLVLLGQSQIIFEKVGLNTPISFATWLVYGLPLSFILVIVVWLWLQIFFLRCRGGCDCVLKRGSGSKKDDRGSKVRAIIRAEFKKLGPITYAEGTIMVFFAILVVLWITRDLGGAGGWGNIFKSGFVSDSTPAILTAVLMFVLPSTLPDIFFRSRRQAKGVRRPVTALLNWKILHEKMPWSLYLLLGGGFAIARATQESGLSLWLGEKLEVFGALDPWLMLLIICYIITFVTEVTSNTAIATIMMPILAQLSLTLNLNPLFFMFPTAITTSFAFMLPVATPPNAIVFAFGAVRVIDMVTCGFVLNVLSVPFLLLATVTWGNAFFHFDVLPPEFLQNATTLASSPAV